MNKNLFIGLFVLSVLAGVAYTRDGFYHRTPQSCDGTQPGLFWDGQKCERCANEYCFCKEYNTCDSCQKGYSLFKLEEDKPARCFKCPEGALDCCFHGAATDFLELYEDANIQNHDSYDQYISENYLVRRAMQCSHHVEGDKQGLLGYIKRYGGQCHYIHGCTKYNTFGQCYECAEGFYFDSDKTHGTGVCQRCHETCKVCRGPGQCDTCHDGFYLETNKDRHEFLYQPANENGVSKGGNPTTPSQSISSVCKPCKKGCLCSGKITKGTDIVQRCDIGCVDYGYAWNKATNSVDNTCEVCPKHCHKCHYVTESSTPRNSNNTETSDTPTTGTKVLRCKECMKISKIVGEFSRENLYAFAELDKHETDENKKCKKCPDYCTDCHLITYKDKTYTSCKKDKCFNGYYPIKDDDSKVVTCNSCQDQSYRYDVRYNLRCSEINLPTQCGDSRQYDHQAVQYRDQFPETKMYHLIKTGDKTAKCVQNNFHCKKIASGQQGIKDLKCSECYEDLGYVLEQSSGQCKLCQHLSEGCIECVSTPQETTCNKCQEVTDVSVSHGYKLVDGQCEACALNCQDCTSSGKDKCDQDKCFEGFFYIDQTEEKTNKFCNKCEIEQCSKCTHEHNCQQCKKGYSLWRRSTMTDETNDVKDYKCVKCPPMCRVCSDETSGDRRDCSECEHGAYLANGICHKQKNNCQIYEKEGGKCKSCAYGYRAVDGVCLDAFNPETGYVNTEFGCQQTHRLRDDGDWLNSVQFDNWMPPIVKGHEDD